MDIQIPQFVKACLWSYDVEKMDFSLPNHRRILIQNILNRGTSDAVSWLKENFSEDQITEVIKESSNSSWNKKSLALWSLVYNISPVKKGRFV
ncbi:MAG: hypothetical protein WCK03_04305 [Candidatus Taylorbacteria bacterium]